MATESSFSLLAARPSLGLDKRGPPLPQPLCSLLRIRSRLGYLCRKHGKVYASLLSDNRFFAGDCLRIELHHKLIRMARRRPPPADRCRLEVLLRRTVLFVGPLMIVA